MLGGAPSVTWSPLGGPNGTIVLSDSRSNSVFINQARGQGVWKEVKTNAGRGAGRELKVREYSGSSSLFIARTISFVSNLEDTEREG